MASQLTHSLTPADLLQRAFDFITLKHGIASEQDDMTFFEDHAAWFTVPEHAHDLLDKLHDEFGFGQARSGVAELDASGRQEKKRLSRTMMINQFIDPNNVFYEPDRPLSKNSIGMMETLRETVATQIAMVRPDAVSYAPVAREPARRHNAAQVIIANTTIDDAARTSFFIELTSAWLRDELDDELAAVFPRPGQPVPTQPSDTATPLGALANHLTWARGELYETYLEGLALHMTAAMTPDADAAQQAATNPAAVADFVALTRQNDPVWQGIVMNLQDTLEKEDDLLALFVQTVMDYVTGTEEQAAAQRTVPNHLKALFPTKGHTPGVN